jgi:hypothetical protein
MSSPPGQAVSQPKALICIEGSADAVALQALYGQPLLFHQIKQLQRLGIKDIAVAIETIPSAVLALADRLASEGTPITLLRNPADLATFCPAGSALLVRSSDVWADDHLLKELLSTNGARIATLSEQPENQAFERIDLNRRWAGLAMIDGAVVARANDLTEGWSLDSVLLRHAIQASVAEMPVKQDAVASGVLRKLDGGTAVANLGGVLGGNSDDLSSVERALAKLWRPILPHVWQNSWVRPAVEWSFPVLSALSAALAFSSFSVLASIVAIIGLFLSNFRYQVRAAEYVGARRDLLAWISLILLVVSLILLLEHAGAGPLGATLSAVILATSIGIASFGNPEKWLREFSPQMAATIVMLGCILNALPLIVSVLTIATLAAIFTSHSAARKTDTELNPN